MRDLLSAQLSVVVTLVIIATFVSDTECGRLNDYIQDYQPLVYDRTALHRNHQRVRRSPDTPLHIKFTAYDRDFRLVLTPSRGAFSDNHQVFTDGVGLHRVDTSAFLFQGHVQDEPNSRAYLSIHKGHLQGEVDVGGITYHIEPAAKYLTHPHPDVHTIIYSHTHLNTDPYREKRAAEAAACGVDHSSIRDFMDRASTPMADPEPRAKFSGPAESRRGHSLYSEWSNKGKRSVDEALSRHKRALGVKNTCALHMRADALLFEHFKHANGHTIADEEAEEEVLAFFSSHVNAMTRIYSHTQFQTYDGQMKNVGLQFVIHRSTIMKDCNAPDRSNDYCVNSLDVSNYLDLTSAENHDDYCLVFTFTKRDFSGGTLGLAWVATESSVQSGVCGRNTLYTGGKRKSLNTGIVTIINFGKIVPNPVSQLTLAHEAGHNFGSPHDEGSAVCAPFGTSQPDANQGNYIMFPSATSGDKPHNDQFSPCSKDNMTRIIQQVVDGVRFMCFVESGQSFCGNKITEEGEECDCGFGTCAPETCCQGVDPSISQPGCTVRLGTQCSPDSGPCCNNTCYFKAPDAAAPCREHTECKESAFCSGTSFRCPEGSHKANGTYCNDYTRVCSSGECIGPVCTNIGWEECFQTSADTDSTSLCYVACRNPSTDKCISSRDTAALSEAENAAFKTLLTNISAANPNVNDEIRAVQLEPGSACDNFLGYCDNFGKCQRIDSEGPFTQLTNMIFNPVTLTRVKEWIEAHWWATLLIACGLVVCMGIFIKVFSYNTPSEDPKKTKAQSNRRSPASVEPYHTGVDMDMSHMGRNMRRK